MSPRNRKTAIPQFVIVLGKRIREVRNKKEKSIEEIAFKAGIDAQNLRKYELGHQEMKVSMMKRIADALEIPLTSLLNPIEK